MEGDGTLIVLAQELKVLVGDLLGSSIYGQGLAQCLDHPYDEEPLGEFLALDNICRGLCASIGRRDAADLRRKREKVFEGAWGAFVVSQEDQTREDRERLWNVLLNLRPSKRTPDDVHEQIEIGLK